MQVRRGGRMLVRACHSSSDNCCTVAVCCGQQVWLLRFHQFPGVPKPSTKFSPFAKGQASTYISFSSCSSTITTTRCQVRGDTIHPKSHRKRIGIHIHRTYSDSTKEGLTPSVSTSPSIMDWLDDNWMLLAPPLSFVWIVYGLVFN